MKKQDVSKCALLLSLFLAASSSQLVHAEEPVSDTASNLATNVAEKLPSADMNSESSDINVTTNQLDATLAPKAEAITTETSEKASSEASQSDTMAQTPVEGQSLNLRILSTTDLHTNLVNYDYYQDMPSQKLGLAKTAVLIDEARKENSNVVLVDNGDILQGTPVIMAGKYGDHLGLIDLEITFQNGKWSVNKDKSHAQIRKIDTKSELADASIVEIAKEAHDGTVAYVRKQVGTTSAPITSYFALVKDDPSIQIVNNAQRWYAAKELAGTAEANLPLLSAAVPFKAGTRNDPSAYTDIPVGPIAIKNVADLYLYDNVTAILKVNGADLKEWLEMAAGQFNTINPSNKEAQNLVNTEFRTYNFDVIDGVTYEFDVTQANKYDKDGNLVNPNSSRVRNLKYMGKEVTADQEFIVVTNNYRASGNFPGVKNATVNRLLKLENRQAIIDYIVSEKTINPSADNNWYFADTINGLDLRFLSADKAKDLIANSKDIAYVGPSATAGFSDFTFTYMKPDQMTSMTSTGMSQADRQAIHQLAAKVYKETRSSGQMQASLPKTGQKQSTGLAILGMTLVGLVALFKKPRKQN
ncbi:MULTISPECIES: 5'-nucleotidase C-terminal domain-containing protein [Streptococcus]|uniref:Bifunctional 2',3'-cyclic nucleotide 2'-phosphodiesterase/3'-nucleotidase protein n=1 Tax=Streptococcus ictaluri 707-05 TaxID=764299 RepID=G5JZP8_9STRE|nr:5'-nucleotidase C-terminal domain-containing protein [Streptococcus ictaluri]EHI70948.1 bifunctional 2',3'-cyclic nucleotide 2'-phosphodiesterase/3'-nucleotidase protein [Streptococcus ictaluri 707-05]